MNRRNRASGFTLVEILIVVIILGILAAIVIPQFTEASSDAKESSLRSNLQAVRSQLELYKVQHNDSYPLTANAGDFEACMTQTTDVDGDITGSDFGPYLQHQFPANPFNGLNTVRVDGAAAGADTHGWRFDSTTGLFQADDSGTCTDGVTAHSSL